jgi:prepilin-type N-terminal cleavage/methylation domain-containing protein
MKKRDQQGFTLAEILIALFVLSVVLLAISTIVFSVMRATSQSKEMATATTLVQDKLETLRNASVASLGSGNDSIILGNITYLRQWIISTSGNIKTITVSVNWNSRGTHNVSMTTLRGD